MPDLPQEVEDLVKSIKEDNPDMDKSTAIAIARDQLNLAADDDCPDGHAKVGDECIPIPEGVDSVDAPPSILSDPQHLTLKSLDTEPIERTQEDDTTVRYKSLKLLSPGVWSDAGSETATFYPPEGIANLDPHYNESEHDGPPVNIMHDLDMETFEAHEASVAGHIDPETLSTDDDGNLYGDVVLDTSTGAGQFADENLQSTLENEGTVGFGGPSVEIPGEGLEQSHDPVRDMPRVDGGRLTGVALVMDPASKSVNFAREAARRPVAMSADGQKGKVLTRQAGGMSPELPAAVRLLGVDPEAYNRALQEMDMVQNLVDQAEGEGFDSSEQTVSELIDFVRGEMDPEDGALEALQDAADAFLETVEADSLDAASAEAFRDWAVEQGGAEMEDDEDEEEDEEDTEMQDDDLEMALERLANLETRLEDVEDAVSQAMTAEDVDAELEDAAGNKLADAETVKTLKEAKADLEDRIQALEDEPGDSKTLADASEGEFEPTYDNTPASESSW